MARKKREKPQREVTKHQLSRWQQQRKRQRIIFGLGIFIIVAVLGIVGTGWYINQYQPLHQTVININGTKFNMDYYIKMLKFYGKGQPILPMYFLVNEVVTIIQQNELIRQGTMELGISVSDKEVDEEIKSHEPPFNDAHRDVVRSQLLISKLQDEYFEQEVPVYAEQRHIMAMFLESESQVAEVSARIETGKEFADLAGELSLESLSKEENGDLGWRPKDVLTILFGTSILEEYIFSSEVGVLSQPIYDEEIIKNVGYWLVKVLERTEEPEETDVQVILLASEEEAQRVKDQLETDDDFGALAEELSQHDESRGNGGELTGVTPDMMSSALSEFIFNPEVELGVISEPIRDDTMVTKGGFWLIKVVAVDDNRRIEDSDRDLLKAESLNKWLEALWDDPKNKIEVYLDDEQKAWAIEKATK